MILGDGILGQMMEPVSFPQPVTRNGDVSWATTGAGDGPRRLINSIHLEPDNLERHNLRLLEKYRRGDTGGGGGGHPEEEVAAGVSRGGRARARPPGRGDERRPDGGGRAPGRGRARAGVLLRAARGSGAHTARGVDAD